MQKRVVKTLEPIKTLQEGNNCTISLWNREYKVSKNPFLSSIISGEEELLAAPIRVVGTENGSEIKWDNVENFLMAENNENEVKLAQTTQSDRFILNTAVSVEYDGCMDWHLSIMPKGRSVNQTFGLEANDFNERCLTKLWVEISLKKQSAKFYQFYPIDETFIENGQVKNASSLNQAGAIPEESLQLQFKQQIYLGNDNSGFAVFFESDENWQPAEWDKAIECIVKDDELVLRLRLLDSEPEAWKDKGSTNGLDLYPLVFRIGMQATPVKPLPKNHFIEKNVHIDCFKKIPVNYEKFLLEPFEDTNEIVLDRIKRLGVDTLYIHEKWNDFQNSPELTQRTSDRLKLIIKEAHSRGIKVIPYFGYELSSLSPQWGKHHNDYICKSTGDFYAPSWYRYPWQRDLRLCFGSDWKDYFIERVANLLDTYGFDGIYIDSIMYINICQNESHGCGYRDFLGNIHGTYPIWEVREFMKRLYEVVDSRGGIINTHTYSVFPVPTLAFAHTIWDGESIQTPMLHGEIDTVPEEYFRTHYTGKTLGVPVFMLCYSNPPVWTFKQAMSNTLPFGILPKAVDVGEPLEEMKAIWDILDDFDLDNSVWKPYFENNIEVSNSVVRMSYYETNTEMLAYISNMVNKPTGKVTIKLEKPVKEIINALNGEILSTNNDKFEVKFDKFDYLILKIIK